jgi:hypothetical protein
MEKKSGSDLDPASVAKIIEAFCVYSLAWAANSLYGHLTKKVEGSDNPLPPVCSFFSSMFKFGLSDPLAALVAPYLDGNRTIAVAAAEISPYSFTEPDKALSWLHSASATDLVSLGMEPSDADAVTRLRRAQFDDNADSTANQGIRYNVRFASGVTLGLREGDRVIVKCEEGSNRVFSLFTARGRALGTYSVPT